MLVLTVLSLNVFGDGVRDAFDPRAKVAGGALMGRFVLRRLVAMVAVLFAISVVTFSIFNVIPNGDPALRLAGRNQSPRSDLRDPPHLGLRQAALRPVRRRR